MWRWRRRPAARIAATAAARSAGVNSAGGCGQRGERDRPSSWDTSRGCGPQRPSASPAGGCLAGVSGRANCPSERKVSHRVVEGGRSGCSRVLPSACRTRVGPARAIARVQALCRDGTAGSTSLWHALRVVPSVEYFLGMTNVTHLLAAAAGGDKLAGANSCPWSTTSCASWPPTGSPARSRGRPSRPRPWSTRRTCGWSATTTRQPRGTAAATSSPPPPRPCAHPRRPRPAPKARRQGRRRGGGPDGGVEPMAHRRGAPGGILCPRARRSAASPAAEDPTRPSWSSSGSSPA